MRLIEDESCRALVGAVCSDVAEEFPQLEFFPVALVTALHDVAWALRYMGWDRARFDAEFRSHETTCKIAGAALSDIAEWAGIGCDFMEGRLRRPCQ